MRFISWRIPAIPVAIAAVAIGALVAFSSLAHAQAPYPAPADSVITCEVGDTTVVGGGTTTVTCTIVDGSGDPVEGAAVEVSIQSQPGTDATVEPTSGVTDAQGQFSAVLSVGTGAGDIIVGAASGEVSTQVTATTVQTLPPTGTGLPNDDNNGMAWFLLVGGLGALAAVAAGLTTGWLRARSRQRA